MSTIRARVKNGRLTVDEPTELPEGTVLDLVQDDEGDDLTVEERRALDGEIRSSMRSAKRGLLRPAADVIAHLKTRRRS